MSRKGFVPPCLTGISKTAGMCDVPETVSPVEVCERGSTRIDKLGGKLLGGNGGDEG